MMKLIVINTKINVVIDEMHHKPIPWSIWKLGAPLSFRGLLQDKGEIHKILLNNDIIIDSNQILFNF